VIWHEVKLEVQVRPPGLEVAVKPMIELPLETDPAHETFTLFPTMTACTPVGANDTPAATTEADGVDETPVPAAFVAVTVAV
jgi:hypothetical protein